MKTPAMVDGETCPSCLLGTVALRTGGGRFVTYRDERFELPPELSIPTCVRCGDRWMDAAMVRAVTDGFDAALAAKRSSP